MNQGTVEKPTEFLTLEDTNDRVTYWADSVSFWYRCKIDAKTHEEWENCHKSYTASRATLLEVVAEELKSK